MIDGPQVKGNPLRIAVGFLVASYLIGEFLIPKYHLLYIFNLIGMLGLISSIFIFIAGFDIFKKYITKSTLLINISNNILLVIYD